MSYYCERCGKFVSDEEVFGSGRFCSRACANSRKQTDEINKKRSETIIQKGNRRHCSVCGKIIKRCNVSGMCFNCYKASGLAHDVASNNWKKRIIVVGWKSRNIQSYPEKFWQKVLENNNLTYSGPNVPVKKSDGKSNYFLDFYLEKNGIKIDLEIDGKQHEYEERSASDKLRDDYLSSLGYYIYRIKWNEINSDTGKALMEEKINNFISFYNNLG